MRLAEDPAPAIVDILLIALFESLCLFDPFVRRHVPPVIRGESSKVVFVVSFLFG